MRMEVWKFKLTAEKICTIKMPVESMILHIGTQYEDAYVWALVDAEATEHEDRRFCIVGTGSPIKTGMPIDDERSARLERSTLWGNYLGSFSFKDGNLITGNGPLMFHVFELP